MKYKAKLITNYYTENPDQKMKEFKLCGFKVSKFSKLNDTTNLSLVLDLKSKSVEEFLEKLERALILLHKLGLDVWSVVNSQEIILDDEVCLENLNILSLPTSHAVTNTGASFEKIEKFKLNGRNYLEQKLTE